MSFDFVLPVSKEDLLSSSGINQYVVEDVYSCRELLEALEDCKSAFESQGPEAVLKQFDILYSVLSQFNNVESDIKHDCWDLLLKATSSLSNKLLSIVEDRTLSRAERQQYLNVLKMNVYLICQFTEQFEKDATKPSTSTLISGKGKNRVNKKKESCIWNWDCYREEAISSLSQLLQLPLNRLWDPPIMEQEFVDLVTGCCYKLLENPNVIKIRSTKEIIFYVLGTSIKKYNHSLGCSLKIMQLLQHFEHLASPLAQAVEIFASEYGAKNIVNEIAREIGRMDSQDLNKDTSGTRSFSAFLVELVERVPSIVLTNISILLPFLDEESYVMRNCVLTIIGEIIIRLLSVDNLDSKMRITRDKLLDNLEDHLHDVNAFVRSKTLQVWLRLCNENAVPLPRQKVVLEYIIGRLEDKSCNVRKFAVQLMTAFLKSNPFAAKLSLDELKANYEKECLKLKEMMPEQPQEDKPSIEEIFNHDELWNAMLPELKIAVEKFFDKENELEKQLEELSDDDTIQSIMKKISELLNAGKLISAIYLTGLAKETWPDSLEFAAENVNSSLDEENDSDEDEKEDSSECTEMLRILKKIYVGDDKESKSLSLSNSSESSEVFHPEEITVPDSENPVNEVSKQQMLVQYLKDCVTFASFVQTAVPIIAQLLGSKTSSDVLEAIDFFVTSYEFGVSNALVGVRRMLVLIWSKEAGIKEAVVAAYKRLYLNSAAGNQRYKAQQAVKNLSTLISEATMGELTSLEELIREFILGGEIDQHIIEILWQRFSMKIEGTTVEDSNASLVLLGMAAGADVDIVRSNVTTLVKHGLGSQETENFCLVKDTCLVLLKLVSSNKPKAGTIDEPFRFPQNHEIFDQLTDILVSGINRIEDDFWIPMAEQAINVIYRLAEHPEIICGDILKKLVGCILAWNQNNLIINEKEEDALEFDDDHLDNERNQVCPSHLFTCLFAFAGHVAFRQLIHLDASICNELKRRRTLMELKNGKKKASKSETSRTISRNHETSECIEEEMGLGSAAAEDAEADFIRKICEQELVIGNNLMAVLRPLLISVCSNPAKFPEPELQSAASLALAKFMLVSSEFCETHLQLLVTILEKSPHAVIRSNTIIALGDLAFRFPNLIEPWTPHLFARLRDESHYVRTNTLKVMTHLILNDMIKVKGYISEMANCIMDTDENNANLSKLFFLELSKKANAIYNLMPDIISRLSDPDVGTTIEHFRIIMKYLFSFIQKEKQCESLVEKLCQRFRMTRTDQQWRDLAFCLSMLSYNDRSIHKLQEHFSCYGDKLTDKEVYESFIIILSGAKKCAKPELKILVEELEHQIEECHKKGLTEEEIADKAKKSSEAAKTKKVGQKKKGHKIKKGQKKNLDYSYSNEDSDLNEERTRPRRSTRHSSKVTLTKKAVLVFSSDEELDFNDDGNDPSDTENTDPNAFHIEEKIFKKPSSRAPRKRSVRN